MYTNVAGETTTSLKGGVVPAQMALQSVRGEAATMSVSRGLDLLEVQQRVQLFDYAQRAQQYQRLHATLLQSAGRVLPSTSSTMQPRQASAAAAAAAIGCGGLLSFIYAKLQQDGSSPSCPSHQHLRLLQAAAAAAATATPATHQEEPKPSQSYIGLIAMAILSSKERKLVLSDIYQWILDHYAYFRYRGPGWRNSIRHNLSLNDCFVKAGRSANGKGHYWAIHPANVDDFERGDFRRRRAQRKVRRAMGLSVPDDDDSPGPSPSASAVVGLSPSYCSWTPSRSPPYFFAQRGQSLPDDWNRMAGAPTTADEPHLQPGHGTTQRPGRDCTRHTPDHAANVTSRRHEPRARRRLFDMASILAPDEDGAAQTNATRTVTDVFSRQQKHEEHISCTLLNDSADLEYKVTHIQLLLVI